MKKNVICFMLVCVCALCGHRVQAQFSLGNLLNKDAVQNLAGTLLQQNDLTVADLVGTWKYNAPACEFQSDDLLKKAGGSLVSNQIEEKLSGIYSKVGLTADQFSYTFAADSSFTCQLKDRAISGNVSKEADSEQFVLHYSAVQGLLNIGSVKVFIRKSGDTLSIMYEADKLLKVLSAIGSATQNTTLNTIGQLAEGYDGLLVGYELIQ